MEVPPVSGETTSITWVAPADCKLSAGVYSTTTDLCSVGFEVADEAPRVWTPCKGNHAGNSVYLKKGQSVKVVFYAVGGTPIPFYLRYYAI